MSGVPRPPLGPAMPALADSPTLELPPPAAPPARRESPRQKRGSTAAPAAPVPAVIPPDGRLTLGGATWEVYVALADAPENADLKFTFDGPAGLLELEMAAGFLHEKVAELLAALVSAFLLHRDVEFTPAGTVTLRRRPGRGHGLRADKTYYIRSREAVRGKTTISLIDGDPAPDLAIEIDVTSPGLDKLPIYAALGVPEVWVWEDAAITVRRLGDDGAYSIVGESREVEGFPLELAAGLIERFGPDGHNAVVKAFAARLAANDAPPA